MTLGLRAIPSDFDPLVVAAIDARLDGVERDHRARILLAIESGSRAWGFPSPDSDYDCRFLYVRSSDQYLSPWVKRDVIETPLDAVLDVNGWDLGKALKLILKGNAVAIEWLQSPILYRGDAAIRASLLAFAERFADREAVARHYLHLGVRQQRIYFGEFKAVALKKVFYALRPAMALRWLRRYPGQALAPMHFPTLMTQTEVPPEVEGIARDLLARKAVTKELGTAPLPTPIRLFIEAEFETASAANAPAAARSSQERIDAAETLFRQIVEGESAT